MSAHAGALWRMARAAHARSPARAPATPAMTRHAPAPANAAMIATGRRPAPTGWRFTRAAECAVVPPRLSITSSRTAAITRCSGIGATGRAFAPPATTATNSAKSAPVSETQLWLEVLNRAVLDARLEPESVAMTPRQALEVRDARTYLTTPSKDLAALCAMAGVDMEALIERMTLRIAGAGDQVTLKKAEPHKGRGQVRSVLYEFDGKHLTVKQLSELTGVAKHLIYSRLQAGLTLEAALNPVKRQGRQTEHCMMNRKTQSNQKPMKHI